MLRIIINNNKKTIKLGEVKEEINHLKHILEQTQIKFVEQKFSVRMITENVPEETRDFIIK